MVIILIYACDVHIYYKQQTQRQEYQRNRMHPYIDVSEHQNMNNQNYMRQNLQAIYKQQIKSTIYGQWKQIPYPIDAKQQNIILDRIGHCQFYYKNCLYFYGGQEANKQTIDLQLEHHEVMQGNSRKESLWSCFHKYNTSSKQFSKQPINYAAHAGLFVNISHFGWALVGNLLFIFGGCNYENGIKRPSQICSINLDSSALKRYQSKTTLASIPLPRIYPQLLPLQKSLLLIFGGETTNQKTGQPQYHNDMFTFKLETKHWVRIQDTINQKIPVLHQPFICTFNDNNIYLFGGRRQIMHNDGSEIQQMQEDAVYRLKIAGKSVNMKVDCYARKIATGGYRKSSDLLVTGTVDDSIRKTGGIVKYGDKGVFLIQQSKQQKFGANIAIWYFDLNTFTWIQVKQNYDDNLPSSSIVFTDAMQVISTSQKIFISQPPYLYEFSFSQTFLQATLHSLQNLPKSLCFLCNEQKELQQVQKNLIPYEYLQQQCEALQFPYQAIGLLIDNSISTLARNCSVIVNYGQFGSCQNKSAYLIVEDNGAPGYVWGEIKNNEFMTKISSFYATIQPEDLMAMEDNRKQFSKNIKEIQQKQKMLQKQFSSFIKSHTQPPASIQKPTTVPSTHFSLKTEKDFEKEQQQLIQRKQRLNYKKKQLQKQQKLKKFCNNLKLAGIRLGNFIGYACKQKKSQEGVQVSTAAEIRRFYFLRKERDEKLGAQYYVGYSYVIENGNPADPRMQNTYKFCLKQFKKQIKIMTERLKTMNSVFLICDLKDVFLNQEQASNEKPLVFKQMRIKKKQNDVFYGQTLLLNYLETSSISKMQQCCDISLKTYLALLYLNNPDLSLHLSVRENNLEQINTQPFLSTIDRWLSSKKIIEIIKPLDFSDECSVVQVYWFPDFSMTSDTLANKVNGLGFLLNGILIYHKGRLIGRYAVPLGRLLDQLETQNKAGSVFGYLQVKPQYSSNIYNNNLFYPNALEKYFSRIRFVSEYMQTKYKDKRSRNKGDDGHYMQKVSKKTKNDKNE